MSRTENPLVALVTGAAGTVGGAIAHRLGDDGLEVVRTDLVAGRGILVGDLRIPAEVERICDVVTSEHGGVDVLVNVAGIHGPRTPFVDTDVELWWEVLQTNLRGPVLLCRRLVPGMIQRGAGVVCNVTSRAAVWDDPRGSSSAYGTSKAALARFTESLAHEVDGCGVTVTHVSPGMVRSGMTESRPDVDAIPPSAFVPPTVVAGIVSSIVRGDHAVLHGHFVHALDDLDRLALLVEEDPGRRRLSLSPYGPDDPVC